MIHRLADRCGLRAVTFVVTPGTGRPGLSKFITDPEGSWFDAGRGFAHTLPLTAATEGVGAWLRGGIGFGESAATGQFGRYGGMYRGTTFEGSGFGRLLGREINPTPRGLGIVERNISLMHEAGYNTMAIERIRSAMNAGEKLMGADASFYLHEISENTMIERLMPDGFSFDDAYVYAHNAALAKIQCLAVHDLSP